MNREEKALVIDALKNDFAQSQASFLVGVKGLSVAQVQTLRKGLRTKGGSLRIAKARLMKLAVDGLAGVDEMSPFFKEQVGLVFASTNVADVAKLLTEFAKANEVFRIVAGCVDARVISKDKVAVIATLPPREVLLAQVCGTLKAPMSSFVNVLNIQILRLLWTLQKVGEKKQ